ncbi:DUF4860 domain-containing protein [Anaerovorax sp. IOR16]|uniref:DUF4860 domain-containing protein n=1 Tax=Anaerovorax sp. IOR16 TaxID=2773458 RepID=UPI0019D2BE70|nr:DUF4860 domain-containing protein [Anaerovorax sp. IOR16]
MVRKNVRGKGQSAQFLFIMLLFFALAISALFTILFGAKVYENIGQRMEDNFKQITPLAYISNQIKQSDRFDSVSITTLEGISVLKLSQTYNDQEYETLIYYQDGSVKELFTSVDSGLTLDAGIEIMKTDGIFFEMISEDLLRVETKGSEGQSILISLRSGGRQK